MFQQKPATDTLARIRIESEADYEKFIAQIEELWDASAGTPEAVGRDFLVKMVEEYESRNEDLG